MLSRIGRLLPHVPVIRRCLHVDVKPHEKLLIQSRSCLEVSCLPGSEADSSKVVIPDGSSFLVEDGWKITEGLVDKPSNKTLNRILIPAMREVDIVHKSNDPIYFKKYEGLKSSVNSCGPVRYEKLKIPDFFIKSYGDVTGSGYLEGNLNLVTNGSYLADNLTSQTVNITFGGRKLAVHSAYCETMNLQWIVPEDPRDGVTPASLPPIFVYFGTLRGNSTLILSGDANTNIGSFEGSLYLRQRFGNVAMHIGGPCPLVEIDVAEGNVELSLPLSTSGEPISGVLDLQGSQIEIDRASLPPDCLDNWELGEAAEVQTFFANFNRPRDDDEALWRVRTLRGIVKLTGASWFEAMSRCLDRTATSSLAL